MLNKDLEEMFQVVADDTISDAEAVDCSIPEFVEGLELIFEVVKDRLELAKDEAKNTEAADGSDET
jgi:hypothetical protein